GVFVVLGRTAGVLQGLDHFAGLFDADRLVGIAVEAPAGEVLDLVGGFGVAAAADRCDGGPAVGVGGGEAPGAVAAHRQAGEVDAFLVGLVVLLDFVEDGEGGLGARAVGAPALRVGLREDGDEGEVLLLVADGLGEAA